MPYKVHLSIERPYQARITPARLRAAARAALKHQGAPEPGELSVRLTGDEALRVLNRDFLGHDHTTDVLSFPSAERNPETGAVYFGDIAISYPRARAQAAAGAHPVWAELQLLVVHGVLHLLGHDHADPAEHARMWAAQAEILRKLKAPISGPAK
jgi:probable rRNA maturation factor